MKILIVDDHPIFRDGLCHIVKELDKEVTILEASDYDQTFLLIPINPDIDMVLLDLSLPGKNGFELLKSLTHQYSALPIVILSASKQRSDVQRALDSGALGYIPKDTSGAIILDALKLIMSGGIYIPQNISQIDDKTPFNRSSNINLTRRQNDVLTLLVDGHSNKHIAQELQLTEATVKVHITCIFKALNVSNRTQAAMVAERQSLIKSET